MNLIIAIDYCLNENLFTFKITSTTATLFAPFANMSLIAVSFSTSKYLWEDQHPGKYLGVSLPV